MGLIQIRRQEYTKLVSFLDWYWVKSLAHTLSASFPVLIQIRQVEYTKLVSSQVQSQHTVNKNKIILFYSLYNLGTYSTGFISGVIVVSIFGTYSIFIFTKLFGIQWLIKKNLIIFNKNNCIYLDTDIFGRFIFFNNFKRLLFFWSFFLANNILKSTHLFSCWWRYYGFLCLDGRFVCFFGSFRFLNIWFLNWLLCCFRWWLVGIWFFWCFLNGLLDDCLFGLLFRRRFNNGLPGFLFGWRLYYGLTGFFFSRGLDNYLFCFLFWWFLGSYC